MRVPGPTVQSTNRSLLLVPPPPSVVSVGALERRIQADPYGVAQRAPVSALGRVQLERLAAEYDSRGSREVLRVYATALRGLLAQRPHQQVAAWLKAEPAPR